MTSASCKGTTDAPQLTAAKAAPAAAPEDPPVPEPTPPPPPPPPEGEPAFPRGIFGTLPRGTIVPPFADSVSPLCAPSAAAINCNSFCGSLSHALNSGPSVCAAIWAAMLTSPVKGSAATNFTSLILIVLPGRPTPRASLICLATSCALEPAIVNARTSRTKSSFVTSLEKCRLASPAALSRVAKLFSACPESRGIPSSSNLLSVTPSKNPASPPAGSAVCNSFHVVSNCPSVRL